MKLEQWITGLQVHFNHSPFISEVVAFMKTHLPCSECGRLQPDDCFHRGSSFHSRRDRQPVCVHCVRKRNKKVRLLEVKTELLREVEHE